MKLKSFANKVYELAEKMGYEEPFIVEVVNIRRFERIVGKKGTFAAAWAFDGIEGIIFNSHEITGLSWKKVRQYIKHEIAHLITGLNDEDSLFMDYCEVNEIPYYVGTVDGNWKLFNNKGE